jgi:hypothetical protein
MRRHSCSVKHPEQPVWSTSHGHPLQEAQVKCNPFNFQNCTLKITDIHRIPVTLLYLHEHTRLSDNLLLPYIVPYRAVLISIFQVLNGLLDGHFIARDRMGEASEIYISSQVCGLNIPHINHPSSYVVPRPVSLILSLSLFLCYSLTLHRPSSSMPLQG